MEALIDLIKMPKVRDEQNKILISEITGEEIKKAT